MRLPVEFSKGVTLSDMSFAPLTFYFTHFVNVALSTAVQRPHGLHSSNCFPLCSEQSDVNAARSAHCSCCKATVRLQEGW